MGLFYWLYSICNMDKIIKSRNSRGYARAGCSNWVYFIWIVACCVIPLTYHTLSLSMVFFEQGQPEWRNWSLPLVAFHSFLMMQRWHTLSPRKPGPWQMEQSQTYWTLPCALLGCSHTQLSWLRSLVNSTVTVLSSVWGYKHSTWCFSLQSLLDL